MAENAKNWEKTKAYRVLKTDMLDDLAARGLISRQYTDKVEEYMDLWCMRQMLTEDVKERGVYIEYMNGANQFGTTVFPQAIGLGSTFDPAMVQEVAAAIGEEARTMGFPTPPLPTATCRSRPRWSPAATRR